MRLRHTIAAALTVALVVGLAPASLADRFIDDNQSIHRDNIEFIADRGVTSGCNPPANNRYCPRQPVLRYQMAIFLDNLLDLPRARRDYFYDDERSYPTGAEAAQNRLAESRITRGCRPGVVLPDGSSKFCGWEPVTRGQMVAFLVRAIELGYATPTAIREQNPPFRFADTRGHLFEREINQSWRYLLTEGCNRDGTRFCPDQPVTREQMASFLARFIKVT